MAITQWDELNLPKRPGLYINFKKAAQAISGGQRGTVAMVLAPPPSTHTDFAELMGKVLRVESEGDLLEYFGEHASLREFDHVKNALLGGAKLVLLYVPNYEEEFDPSKFEIDVIADMFDRYEFNVFVAPAFAITSEQQAKIVAWQTRSADEGKKPFIAVLGTTKETFDERMTELKLVSQEGVVFLFNGGFVGDKEYKPYEYTHYIAGMVAGTPLNASLTYSRVSLTDVDMRLKNSEIEDALEEGALLLIHDGDAVKVESGVTSDGDKIRKVAVRYSIATDLQRTARSNWIGRITNNDAGQVAIIGAVRTYLEVLQNNEVLEDIVVKKSVKHNSEDDKFFLDIAYTELDSMERIFFTISPQ